jgi:16S rRNA (uracil1498-N3)-methyltransferase
VNILLIDREELTGSGRVLLADRRAEHLRSVLRVVVGQELRAGIVRGPLAVARVLAIGASIELAIETRGQTVVPDLDLIIALPRPKVLPRIVQAVASFGVRRIDIVNAWRVDASYFTSPKLNLDALRLEARLGCEQGVQPFEPDIAVHRFFTPFVEEVLRERLADESGRRLIIAHPTAQKAIESAVLPGARPALVLAIGPDGGFVAREIDSLVAIGGTPAHFGQAVLRSEVAAVAILSQLSLLRRLPPACTANAQSEPAAVSAGVSPKTEAAVRQA